LGKKGNKDFKHLERRKEKFLNWSTKRERSPSSNSEEHFIKRKKRRKRIEDRAGGERQATSDESEGIEAKKKGKSRARKKRGHFRVKGRESRSTNRPGAERRGSEGNLQKIGELSWARAA